MVARASPQSRKLVMAPCQEAGDRCAATSGPERGPDVKHSAN